DACPQCLGDPARDHFPGFAMPFRTATWPPSPSLACCRIQPNCTRISLWRGALIPIPSFLSPAIVDIEPRLRKTCLDIRRLQPNYSEMSPCMGALIPTPSRQSPATVDIAARPRSTFPGVRRVSPNSLKKFQHHHSQAHKQPRNSQEEASLTLQYQCRSHDPAG